MVSCSLCLWEKKNLHCKLVNEKENDDQKLLLKQDLENIFKIWNFQYFRDWKFLCLILYCPQITLFMKKLNGLSAIPARKEFSSLQDHCGKSVFAP